MNGPLARMSEKRIPPPLPKDSTPSEAPAKKSGADGFDVVLVHGKTADGEGASVLRARPGRIEAGEVRPLREGRPLAGGGEVVRLSARAGTPNVYDVDVQCEIPKEPSVSSEGAGPPQVATPAYRESWERTFGMKQKDLPN
jgi:hypothetical protein